MKKEIKTALPATFLQGMKNLYDAVRRTPELPDAFWHPWRRASIRALRELKDTQRGKRAFIIGNGPSLRNTDLSKLQNEFTFGLNRIYLMFPELGFSTSCLVSINDLVIEQCASEMAALRLPRFFAWRSRKHFEGLNLSQNQLPIFLYTSYTGPRFSRDVSGRIWEGGTVTNVALQLAFHMGFERVILIGVDHNFASKGEANKTVVSDGDDPNHFSANYFGKGFRWQLPDLESSEIAYAMARKAYEQAGRQVLDATVGGKLTIFPKVAYETLF